MTQIGDILQQAANDLFATTALGQDATYTPDGGSPSTVQIIPDRSSIDNSFEGTTLRTKNAAVFEVRVSQVATPAAGDTILFDSVTYVVQGVPSYKDAQRLVWALDTRPQ